MNEKVEGQGQKFKLDLEFFSMEIDFLSWFFFDFVFHLQRGTL